MPSSDRRRNRHRRGKIKFERHASQVVFDPASGKFVVTWVKCDRPSEERLTSHKDPLRWKPSISAVATLYDRGCVPPEQIVFAARAIGDSWKAGDRDLLDTESAKKAAELVSDLSSMCVNPDSSSVMRDIGQAMRHLLDEMASVRFMNAEQEEFEDATVMPALEKAAQECLKSSDFASWPFPSKRRRFLYCLNRKERSKVAYTLVSLIFDTGSCPLLSLTDRRILRMVAIRESGLEAGFTAETMVSFFRFALGKMREAKAAGKCRLEYRLTQQQLADCVTAS